VELRVPDKRLRRGRLASSGEVEHHISYLTPLTYTTRRIAAGFAPSTLKEAYTGADGLREGTLMSEVLRLGPQIAGMKALRFRNFKSSVQSLWSLLLARQPNKEVHALMFKATPSRSLLVNLFASASLFAAVSGVAMAQQVALSLGSGSTTAGGSVSLNLSSTVSGGAQPSALQWTMTYLASDVSGVTVTPGAVATAASKSVTCSSSLAASGAPCTE